MNNQILWTPTQLGSIALPHRLAMAPMTRSRAAGDGTVTDLTATYYEQRSSLSMLISEGTQPSADGQGYLNTPGIYEPAHVEAWKRVAAPVHEAGAAFVIQLMHVGRVSHPANTPHGRPPVAPSPIAADAMMFTAAGPQPMAQPVALDAVAIARTVEEFRVAAAMAIDAGADGVEIHGANGYLLHQFLSTNANQRGDEYGGSITGRARFPLEVAAAVAAEIGADRTGFRISPANPFNDITETDTPALYAHLATELADLDLAYLHLVHAGDEHLLRTIRGIWPERLVVNRAGADLDARIADLDNGTADVIAVGTPALANPDLPARVRAGAALNEADPATFYGGDHRGYTDYPVLTT
ncbi:alkene reductase [Nocardia sp. NPDC058705]|uniref:alkene reductase n=1 Tax=Nocardia sp. NPDC058705 TaxID=3346609 RepID=UPI0036BE51B7